MTSGIISFIRWKWTPLALPKEDKTSQNVPASLRFPICCASGRRGTLRGPTPHLPSPKGKDKATCTRGMNPCKAAPDRPQLVRGQDTKKALPTYQFHLSRELKSPVWPGAEGLIAPGPPNAA